MGYDSCIQDIEEMDLDELLIVKEHLDYTIKLKKKRRDNKEG